MLENVSANQDSSKELMESVLPADLDANSVPALLHAKHAPLLPATMETELVVAEQEPC